MILEPFRQNPAAPRDMADAQLLGPPTALRIGLLAFAGVLALGGALMLICDLLLPQAIALPLDRGAAEAAAAHRNRALAAARLGAVRGDLFAQAVYRDADLLWLDRTHGLDAASAAAVENARSNAETSLSLAPINGAVWFFLAALPPSSAGAGDVSGLVPLQMSYFTAANDAALARPRIERALASSGPIDKDLQEFMKGDLRLILNAQPQQKPALVAAFKAATPQNQVIFESLATEVDTDFGRSLHSDDAPK